MQRKEIINKIFCLLETISDEQLVIIDICLKHLVKDERFKKHDLIDKNNRNIMWEEIADYLDWSNWRKEE